MKSLINIVSTNSTEKFLALIITIVIWVIVISHTEETRTFNVEIETILGENLVLESEPITSIHVQATGNKFDFARIKQESKKLKVNLRYKDPGKTMIYFDNTKFVFNEYLKINHSCSYYQKGCCKNKT